MKSLLFIESPLQLLNAYEAIEKFSINDYEIVVRFSYIARNDKQIQYIIDKFNIENVKYIAIRVNDRKIIDYMKLLYYKYIYKVSKNIDTVFIGNYDSGLLNLIMKKVDRKKIILLDDGSKAIDIQKEFTDTINYHLFTMYDFKAYKNQKIIKNNFTKLRKGLNGSRIDEKKILFLGLKLSEIGIITEEYYLEQIIKIASFYQDKKIEYVPHRGESATKLHKLKAIQNIEIIRLDYPIELYGLYYKNIPYKVASFYSTALFTMKNIYGIEAEGFMFDFENSEYKTAIQNVYDYYEYYFKVQNLNA